MQFYLFAPLLIAILVSMRRRPTAAAFLAIMSISYSLQALAAQLQLPNFAFYFPLCRLWEFTAGIAAHLASIPSRATHMKLAESNEIVSCERDSLVETGVETKKFAADIESSQRSSSLKPLTPSIYVLFTLTMPVMMFAPTASMVRPQILRLGTCVATASLIYIGDGVNSNEQQQPLRMAVQLLAYLGDMSYALYLVHWPVILFAKYMLDLDTLGIKREFITQSLPIPSGIPFKT